MKSIITILLFALLTGCANTAIIKSPYPKAPPVLQSTCKPLDLVKDNPSLSELTAVVVENYNKYHECAAKQNGWVMWYNTQSNIFNND